MSKPSERKTGRDIGISQPGQRNSAGQWGIVGTGEAWEPILSLGLLIALMMEATRTSETLVNFYQITRCYNPEDSNLHTHRRENLKSY
jgi:hypothetical protein